jgi:Tfp pilus assembly protein PilE
MNWRICNPGAGRPRARRRSGMAVVELLIALAISGMVLVAVAYCVDTAFRAYSINQEQSDLMQRSRLAMHRILTTIRTTSAHQPVDPLATAAFESGLDVTDTAIRMIDVNEVEIMFRFDPVNGMLMAVDKNGNEYVLVRGVETFEVKFEPMRTEKAARSGGVYDRLMRATVKLTVKTSGNSVDIDESVAFQRVTLSSSAVPRQNVW